jgi:crotonobetainyl-CoA:carnitine CoA-transferase CaiB-like acyl-CoA transferase
MGERRRSNASSQRRAERGADRAAVSGPLHGVLVVAVEQAVAAPLATRHLGDLGARVIKVERPDVGDFARGYDDHVRGLATHFVWANRNKESLSLDIKTARGAEVLARLLGEADVFVQNMAPGTADRLGLSAQQLVAEHPRLIACDVSGYGDDGPYAGKRAYDMLVQAEAGVISVTGTPQSPARAGIAVADVGAGMYAYSAILAALFARERGGAGMAISVSLFDAVVEWMGYSIYSTAHGTPHVPAALGHPAVVPYNAYPTSDGCRVIVGVQNDREWQRLATQVLDRPDLAADPELATNQGRCRHRARVDDACAAAMSCLTFAEAVARLDGADIANSRINSVEELLAHPQLRARDRWRPVDSPVGAVPMLLPAPVLAGWEPRMDAIPALGEHTDAILGELGYDSDAIAGLRRDGVV